MDPNLKQKIGKALAQIPCSLYVMTACHENRSRGVLVGWVQQVSFEPPMVLVALRKGRHIVPLIHDSHSFALCQLSISDKLSLRRFQESVDPEVDQFQGLDVIRAVTHSPILARAVAYMDCELVRHFDIDADHDLYIGHIRDAGVSENGTPIFRTREDGFAY